MGKGRDATGEEEADTLRGGWAEPPASSEGGTASRSHYKRRKSYTQRGGGRGRAKCPIYTQHCKHTQSILHVLQSGVCLSVCQSVLGMELRSLTLLYFPNHLPANPGNRARRGMVPKFRRNKQAGLFHSGSRVLYVCLGVYMHVCTRGTCVQVCTRGRGGYCLLEARPAWTASS